MAGGKSTPKKDKKTKVAQGELVKTGKILIRGVDGYKAGKNVKGLGTIYALCPGKVNFTRKRIAQGKVKTFINVIPE
ncbi:MAG: 50S ribosomal protein L27 [Candidatus Omnitrophica bacterium]|jgi:ribosomal protein L27|nr:50S ribosomal protein L27 [Candidatus Omnitrophota bacterium]MDD5079508.1 50S ribosomal protein L27 [Candidatus Omnitrophota bacterium]